MTARPAAGRTASNEPRPGSRPEPEPEPEPGQQPPIADYGLIGDCRSCALVSREGSIDWLCLPDFSSPSIFAALLDARDGGRFGLAPRGRFESRRSYIGDTAVLETVFSTPGGTARVIDAMIVGDPDGLRPRRELLRIVEGMEGRVAFDLRFDPRPDYGRARARLDARAPGTVAFSRAGERTILRGDAALRIVEGGGAAEARFETEAGTRHAFSLAFVGAEAGLLMPTGDAALARLETTLEWWRDWVRSCTYRGRHRDAVIRSALTLKLLTYALSGAVVAAATTSLPEAIGGARNWDYRYCWLRDAALTMRAFLGLGLRDEAAAFLRWLLHATALTQPQLRIMYDVFGRSELPERELGHLAGYRGSRPVRIGNGAEGQLQLDVYGAIVSAAAEYAAAGGALQHDQLKLVAGFGRTICARWREPDHGIWESRGEREQHTFSKLMCWLGLDCLLRLDERQPLGIERRAFAAAREEIRATIEAEGYDEALGSYVSVLGGGGELDASLLLMSCLGYAAPGEPRMRSTFGAIRARLGEGALLYRYPPGTDGFDSTEGAFGICSFWAVENLVGQGEIGQAMADFGRLLSYGNDLCLFSEEIDPRSGALLGNFPQAFTHVGLINAALALDRAAAEDRP